MVKIRSYTSLEQSKKLAEILPLESADMCFNIHNNMPPLMTPYSKFKEFFNMEPTPAFLIPCWSLVASLKIIGHYTLQTVSKDKKVFIVSEENYPICSDTYSEPIDACYEMIIKLHELNLL